MKTYEWTDGMGYMILEFNQEQVDVCSHQGERYDDCAVVANEIDDQLRGYENHEKVSILSETCVWSEDELTDENENDIKIVWIACCDISEEPDRYAVTD
jgi:hypothetical protein